RLLNRRTGDRLRRLGLFLRMRRHECERVLVNRINQRSHKITVRTPTKELQASPNRGRSPRLRRKALNQGKDLFRGVPGVWPYDLDEIQAVFGLEVRKDVLAVLVNQTDERCASPVWVASIHFSRRT